MIRKAIKSQLAATAQGLVNQSFLASPDATILSSLDHRILAATQAATKLFGYSVGSMKGLPTQRLYARLQDWHLAQAALDITTVPIGSTSVPVTLLNQKGNVFDARVLVTAIVEYSGARSGYSETFFENSGSSVVNKGHAHGKNDMVRLTRGIAHDFNNLLAIIGGNVQLAAQIISNAKAKHLLREAELACEMGAGLTARMKLFAGDSHLSVSEVDIAKLLRLQLPLLRGTLGPSTRLVIHVARYLPIVIVDKNALENAVLNLVLNARDAMPGGGVAELSACSIDRNRSVRISLRDTGSGMTARTLALAFDPFFTTKPPGRGTGLGLSTVLGFAKQSGGNAHIESTPGKGTTVSIILPAAAASL